MAWVIGIIVFFSIINSSWFENCCFEMQEQNEKKKRAKEAENEKKQQREKELQERQQIEADIPKVLKSRAIKEIISFIKNDGNSFDAIQIHSRGLNTYEIEKRRIVTWCSSGHHFIYNEHGYEDPLYSNKTIRAALLQTELGAIYESKDEYNSDSWDYDIYLVKKSAMEAQPTIHLQKW